MQGRGLRDRILGFFGRGPQLEHSAPARGKGPVSHVIILDGTMSTLTPGLETNAGMTYRLLREVGFPVSVYYEAGVQWRSWRRSRDVLMGRGINRQIRRAYGYLASRYHPGDRIFLIGYSRGAFAVRSLAGVIDRVGLLRHEHATVRNVRQAYRLYEVGSASGVTSEFAGAYCHDQVEIEMIGVWDTVKALGLRLPLLWRLTEQRHQFHDHQLGPAIRNGFHALALDETRSAFDPVLWETPENWDGRVHQVWFRGTHGDVGGMLGHALTARPLSNVPLVWMLEQMEARGIPLPPNWPMRYPTDPQAPSVGTWQGWGKMFLIRGARVVGQDKSESIHHTAATLGYSLPTRQETKGQSLAARPRPDI